MKEQIQLARRYARMVWPYRWPALALASVICLIGWVYVLFIPNSYEVSAKIFVDTRSMLRPLMRGLAVDNDTLASSASLMKRTLVTRPNLEDVARKVDLDLSAKTDREFDTIVATMAKKIKLSGTVQDNIYEISYEDSDVQLAKRIVDELLNSFLETALGSNRKDTASTQKFLEQQISEYEKRLLEAEQRLKEFKQRNVGLMPSEGASYFQDLETARARLRTAQLDVQEAENRSNTLRMQLEGEEPVLGMMGDSRGLMSPVGSQYDGRIAKLEAAVDQLRMQYTDKHPEVVATLQQLEDLKNRRDEELAAAAESQAADGGADLGGGDSSLVYQDVKLALAEAEAEVAGLRARVDSYGNEVKMLEKQVDTMPEIEAELKRLDRDYGLNKQQYDELLKRREAARLSEEVDQRGDDIKLKIIEPPRIPLSPVGPKRVQLMSLVLVMSLGLGGGFAFLMSQINPRFYSAEDVKEIAQLPILGTVSLVFNERQRTERRMEMIVFALVLFGLLSLYGGLVGLEMMNFDLNSRISKLVEKTA
ncbi:MAG: chain-length determining protein [Gammaproteobacteria bacterium]|nr:chain-length determining protein [Gammaproteobacteria bacterium]